MTHFSWTSPTARKRHRCALCVRVILPGEEYHKCAGLDGWRAWTLKYCDHCMYVSHAYGRVTGDDELDDDSIIEWLMDVRPTWYAQMDAGWRYPDGELLPPPFQPCCIECGAGVSRYEIWCMGCNEERIQRLNRQFAELQRGTLT